MTRFCRARLRSVRLCRPGGSVIREAKVSADVFDRRGSDAGDRIQRRDVPERHGGTRRHEALTMPNDRQRPDRPQPRNHRQLRPCRPVGVDAQSPIRSRWWRIIFHGRQVNRVKQDRRQDDAQRDVEARGWRRRGNRRRWEIRWIRLLQRLRSLPPGLHAPRAGGGAPRHADHARSAGRATPFELRKPHGGSPGDAASSTGP